MTAHDAPLRTFGQESRDASAQAGYVVITPEQAAAARRQVARYCRSRGLDGADARRLIEMLGVGQP